MKDSHIKSKRAWFQQLKGWQKVLGLISFVAVLLIMINPEFLALGLLGDTAFFDLLVLALSLQMHTILTQAWRQGTTALASVSRSVGIPSPGLRYVLAMAPLLIAAIVSSVQKVVQRFTS
jgi:hypothetical protein